MWKNSELENDIFTWNSFLSFFLLLLFVWLLDTFYTNIIEIFLCFVFKIFSTFFLHIIAKNNIINLIVDKIFIFFLFLYYKCRVFFLSTVLSLSTYLFPSTHFPFPFFKYIVAFTRHWTSLCFVFSALL